MVIRLFCNGCAYEARVPEVYRVREIPCPQCSTVLSVDGQLEKPDRPCPYCAERVKDGARKCKYCGEIIDEQLIVEREMASERKFEHRWKVLSQGESAYAKNAFLCAIIGLFGLGTALGPVAFVLGHVALNEIKKDPSLRGRRMAVMAMVLGVLEFIGWTLTLLMFRESL